MVRDPFRKCKECPSRRLCRRTRSVLGWHLATNTPGMTANWPLDYSLCPACMLTFPFQPMPGCPICGGAGEVAQKRIRGTADQGNQFWYDVRLCLLWLPTRQRHAVQTWVILGDLQRLRLREILKQLRTSRRIYRRRLCAGLTTMAGRLQREEAPN